MARDLKLDCGCAPTPTVTTAAGAERALTITPCAPTPAQVAALPAPPVAIPAPPARPTGPQGNPGPVGGIGPAGPPGIQGTPGIQGATGATGAAGAPGVTGAAGAPGAEGERGLEGEPGSPGATGARGETGAAGAAGAQGDQGERGDDGLTIVGPTGAQGERGQQGAPGNDGERGDDGAPGTPGAVGPTGATGDPGPTGAQGQQGAPGSDGETGAQGDQGAPGAPGAAGATGATGASGADGAAGAPGAFTQGEQGPEGEQGIPIVGATGPQGERGQQGAPGTDGEPGPQGDQGPPGDPGADGATGATGASGVVGSVLNTAVVDFGVPATSGNFLITGLSGLVVNTPINVTMAVNIADPTDSEQQCWITGVAISSSVISCYWNSGNDRMSGLKTVQYITSTATGNLTLSPGQFVGLPIDNGVNGPARAITGAQGGENIRFDTWATDTSVGNQPDFSIALATTGVKFTPASALNLQGLIMPGQGRLGILSPSNTSALITLEHASPSEATAGRKFQNPGQLSISLFQNENAWVLNDSNAGRMRLLALGRARSAVQANSGPIFATAISPVETLNFVGADLSVASGVATIELNGPSSTQLNEEFCSFQLPGGSVVQGDTGWAFSGTGTSTLANRSTADPNHPGAWALTSGATINGIVDIFKGTALSDTPFLLGSVAYFRWVVQLRTANTQERVLLGLYNSSVPFSAPSPSDSIVAFSVDVAGAAGNWLCVTASGSTLGSASSGVPAALDTWYTLEAYIAGGAAPSQIDYFINGTKVSTVIGNGANIPTSGMNFIAGIKTLDTNTKSIDLDNASIRFGVTR